MTPAGGVYAAARLVPHAQGSRLELAQLETVVVIVTSNAFVTTLEALFSAVSNPNFATAIFGELQDLRTSEPRQTQHLQFLKMFFVKFR